MGAGATKSAQGELNATMQVDNVMFAMRNQEGSSSRDSSRQSASGSSGSDLVPVAGARGVGEAFERNDPVYRLHQPDSRPMAEGLKSSHGGVSFAGSSSSLGTGDSPRERTRVCTKQQDSIAEVRMQHSDLTQDSTAAGSDSLIPAQSMLVPEASVNFACPAIVSAGTERGTGHSLLPRRIVPEQLSQQETALSTTVITYMTRGTAPVPTLTPSNTSRNSQPVASHALSSVTPGSANRAWEGRPTSDAVQPLQLSRLSPSRLQGNVLDVSRFEDAVSSSAFTAEATDSPTHSADQLYLAQYALQATSPTPSSSAFTAPRSYLNSPVQQLHAANSGSALQLSDLDAQQRFTQQPLDVACCSPRSALQDPGSDNISARCSMSPEQPMRSFSGAQEPKPHCDIFPAVIQQAFRRTVPRQVMLSTEFSLIRSASNCISISCTAHSMSVPDGSRKTGMKNC